MLRDGKAFQKVIEDLAHPFLDQGLTKVVGIEARGFILGAAVAHRLGTGFVPIRKAGKLPWKTHREEYDLEYGKDVIEMHIDGVTKSDRILLVDDLIATGGTAVASLELLKRCGGEILGASFVIELPALKGRVALEGKGVHVRSLLQY